MAVVTRYTSGYPGVLSAGVGFQGASAHEAKAQTKALFASIAMANGDSINSIYKLGRIPSNAIILPISNIYTTATTGLTSVSVGLDDRNGTALATALVSAVDMHAGGAFAAMSNVTVDKYNKRAWDLLGLAADPGAELDVYAKLGAATTATGTMAAHIFYTVSGI
jgi:hypothetical protein